MRVLLTGACGFVGSTLARALPAAIPGVELWGIDNFSRPGAFLNREAVERAGLRLRFADIRLASDLESLPRMDWVIDAAANASVLAGVDGKASSRQLVENNLLGTVNLLELCRRDRAGFVLLSTSRVYNVPALAGLPVRREWDRLVVDAAAALPAGVSPAGVTSAFSTQAPVSLYGATKLASEVLALEYGMTYGFPTWINRCGVMAGAGQFGRPDQGIVAYWLNAARAGRPLRYLGFGGTGAQVRDCFHPADLATLLAAQLAEPGRAVPRVINVGGGQAWSFSLAELTTWAESRLGRAVPVERSGEERPFDIPWMVMDPAEAERAWGWRATTSLDAILAGIWDHAGDHPGWLDLSAPL